MRNGCAEVGGMRALPNPDPLAFACHASDVILVLGMQFHDVQAAQIAFHEKVDRLATGGLAGHRSSLDFHGQPRRMKAAVPAQQDPGIRQRLGTRQHTLQGVFGFPGGKTFFAQLQRQIPAFLPQIRRNRRKSVGPGIEVLDTPSFLVVALSCVNTSISSGTNPQAKGVTGAFERSSKPTDNSQVRQQVFRLCVELLGAVEAAGTPESPKASTKKLS